MKKLLAAILTLVLVVSIACSAMAEVVSYVMIGAQDSNGNVATIEDTEMPTLVFAFDMDSDACAFGDENEQYEGTYACYETDDADVLQLDVVLSDGTTVTLYYGISADQIAYVDEANGLVMVLANAATIAQ